MLVARYANEGKGASKMTIRCGDWVETYSGIPFYSFDPRLEEISLQDIAHSLSLICRFNGHTKYLYTVAQHSLNVQRLLKHSGKSAKIQLKGLLHDASEAYLCDIPRPLKPYVHGYFEAEMRVQSMIYKRFGVADIDCIDIKIHDDQMLGYEANRLMPCVNWSPPDYADIFAKLDVEREIDVSECTPLEVEMEFLGVAKNLITVIRASE